MESTFILSDYGLAVPCLLEEMSDSEQVFPPETMVNPETCEDRSTVQCPQGSRPLAAHMEPASSSPSTEDG